MRKRKDNVFDASKLVQSVQGVVAEASGGGVNETRQWRVS